MNHNASLYQSTNSSTATLRPRNSRLISFIDDDNDSSVASTSSAQPSRTPPLFSSRGTSPNAKVSRTKSLDKGSRAHGVGHTRKTSEGGVKAQNNDLWTSWSSYASSFLTGDTGSGLKGKDKAGPQRPPKWMKQDRGYNSGPTTPKWGLSSKDMPVPAPGSIEIHKTAVLADRRKALLSANAAVPDVLGRFKRRDSDAIQPYDENEEEALVYMHRTQKNDTLAGVMLKYGCQPEVFRKVNRFWPNDNIQTRTHVFLPVEACTLRGEKTDAPQHPHYLGAATNVLDNPKPTAELRPVGTHALCSDSDPVMSPALSALSLTISLAEDDSLLHDSWVLLPNFQDPVEILRMSRRSLGYFPRARRKSNATLTDTSTASTPKTSFDMLRHPPSHAAQVTMSLNASPVRRPVDHLRRDSGRQRSSSTTASQASFTEALRGPGGVGNLRGLRTEPSRPGPADDPLNQKFRHYFPDLVLTPQQDMPVPRLSTPLRSTPRVSTDSVRSQRSNSSGLGDVGGALEGWVRKLAHKKDKAGSAKMGDLIELETNSELGEPIIEDDFPTPTQASGGFDNAQATTSATEEALLNERFPMRGRVMSAYGNGQDKGG